ncbi:hypothetical protein [Tenuibacillus multivorans]|uniref:Di-and tricarboxylate transporter n=1 Tax=Tenuibacillus multivorans TaxID=237069 RepID=A0A1H0C0F5_9BACI|nr:hypothetical protein [Tenuibacillus multivorans]GEL77716.1 hypothetical protein TMU01_19510 [Tenuibacillus multivorans]SDN51373.1 hypothetical protein SAMN05216498_2459 [Tenuibacillus multivorans]
MKPKIIRPVAALLMGLTYLFSQFVDHPALPIIVSMFAAVTIVSFIPYLSKTPMILISSLLVISALMSINGEGLTAMFNSLNSNVGLLAIFIFVPLIAIPIRTGKYLDYLDTIFNHYVKSSRQLYIYLKMSIMGVGAVMNLGTIPIMYHLTGTTSFESYEDTRLKALIRGFAMSFLWSPYFISIALMLSYFDITWIDLFPIGFAFAIIGLLLGFLTIGTLSEPIETVQHNDETSIKKARRKLIELVLIIVAMTGLTMTIEHSVDLSVLTIIPIMAIIVSVIWSLFYQSPKQLGKNLLKYSQERLPKMGNELSLFIAAGTFGVAILNAGANDWIIYFLEGSGITHVLLLIPILTILVNALSFVGIHPIITNTTLAITLSTSPIFAEDHLILSIGLLIGWMMTILISPFSATNLMVGSLTNSNSVRVGLRMNWKYAIVLYAIFYLLLVGLYFIL